MRRVLFVVLALVACSKPKPLPPPPPPPPTVLVELAMGATHACARSDKGSVFCWGENGAGQVGRSLTAKQATPQRIDIKATALAAGVKHTCAIDLQGAVFCWGGNDHGQLGDGTIENRYDPTKILDAGPFTQIAAAGDRTCARKKADGTILCWGELESGVATKAPAPVPNLPSGAEQVALGQAHACARYNDGTVKCWGENYKRQLGVSSKTQKNVPVDVPEISAAQIAVGREHSCGRTAGGEVFCWGGGLLCLPGESKMGRIVAVKPAKVAGMDNVVDVRAGGEGVCGIFTDGQVGCAVMSEKDKSCATERVAPEALYGVRVLGMGASFACVVLKGGLEAYCWGSGQDGQLGDGKMEDHMKPEPIKHPVED